MLCQRCGKKNESDQERCRFCGAPLLFVGSERSGDGGSAQPFLGLEEYLADKLSSLEQQAHRYSEDLDLLVHALDFLERNSMVSRAGIHVLVQMLREKGLIESKDFNRRWRDRSLANLRDLYRKERFLDAKPEILASFKGKHRRRFDEHVARAEDLLYSLQSSAAADALEEALLLDTANLPLREVLAEFHLSLGDLARAERHLSDVMSQKAPGMAPTKAYAALMIRRKKPEEAERRLTQALQKDGGDPDSWTLVALCAGMRGNWRQCQRCVEKALSLDERPAALYLLSQAHLHLGRVSQSERVLGQILEYYPDWEPALLQLARIHLGRGWWRRAEEVLERLALLDSDLDVKGMVRRFQAATPGRRRKLAAVPLDAEAVLDRMDPAAEEAGMYLRQTEGESTAASKQGGPQD
jgi:tetratricopeptide (TPR) repeat protein